MMGKEDFLEAAEQVTVEKLYNIASAMTRAEEILKDLQESYTSLKKSDGILSPYLLQKAELARLQREIDEAIRDHEVQCHDCGEVHNLRNVALLGEMPKVILRCPQSIMSIYEHLSDAEVKSLERVLRFAQGEKKEIFETKLP